MKREIKFRSWSKERKTMEFWGLWWNYIEYLDESEEIVMQFTGLKDKNGKEIYEGDIVQVGETTLYTIGWYAQSSAFWIFTITPTSSKNYIASAGAPMREWNWLDGGKAIYFHGMDGKSPEVEIIGNIYENKELLTDIK